MPLLPLAACKPDIITNSVCVCVCVCVRVHTLSDVQLFASYTWAQIEMFWHKLPHKEKLLS